MAARNMSWLLRQVDLLLAIAVAVTTAVLEIWHPLDPHPIFGGTLIVLTIVAFGQLRDRTNADRLRRAIDRLSERYAHASADGFYGAAEIDRELIHAAERDICLVQETGSLLLERARGEILALLERGGRARAVLATPSPEILRLLAFRNANLSWQALSQRAQLFEAHVADLTGRAGTNTTGLEVRYFPYPMHQTLVLGDPAHDLPERRRMLVREAGFRVSYPDKLAYTGDGKTSPRVTHHIVEEFERMFRFSSKIVLLSGAPRIGKTTLLGRLVAPWRNRPDTFFVLGHSMWDGDRRIGFEYETSTDPVRRRYAVLRGEGDYDTDEASIDRLADQLETAEQQNVPIVLDEIGPMQMRHPRFAQCVARIVADPSSHLIASIALDDRQVPGIQAVKTHARSTLHVMHSGSDLSALLSDLASELSASVIVCQTARLKPS